MEDEQPGSGITERPRPSPSSRRKSAQRATAYRNQGGKIRTSDASKDKQKQSARAGSFALNFYDAVLRDDATQRRKCSDRGIFDETFGQWKDARRLEGRPVEGVAPSAVLSKLKAANLVSYSTKKRIKWAADEAEDLKKDDEALSFYDAKLRDNPRLRRSCMNRRVLNDTVNKWKIERQLKGKPVDKGTAPASIIRTLMRLELIDSTSNVRENIIWSEGIEDIDPLTAEERANTKSFDQKQMRANRAGLSFYSTKLRDNRILRRACAYRNILRETINQWKTEPLNAGDPPRDSPVAAIIYGLTHQWGLIDHININQGIVAWKEDVRCYNDGVVSWKDEWPYENGERVWVDDDEMKRRRDFARNETVAIAALSLYNAKLRGDPVLRRACSHRHVFHDTFETWRAEQVSTGDPPRFGSSSNTIHALQKEWRLIESFTTEAIAWKEDTIQSGKEEVPSFDDILVASLNLGD